MTNSTLTLALQTADTTLAMRLPYQFCKGFAADGWTVTVLVVAAPQNAGVTMLWNTVPVERIGTGSRQRAILQLGLRLLRRPRHVLAASSIWDRHTYFLALARCLFGSPYVLFLDTFEYKASSTWRGRLRDTLRYGVVLRGANVVLAETPAAFAAIRRCFPRATVLQVPFCLWRGEMQTVEREWDTRPTRQPVILYAGRIIRRKRIDDLISAFSRLALAFPTWRIDIRGVAEDEDYWKQLQAQAQDLGLTERVRFLPPVFGDELYKLYAETELFCLPSEGEGMPSVITEAMFFGGAIVAANSGCLAYQLDNGSCGLLHAPGDVDALTLHLQTLMHSPDNRDKLRAKARARAETVFAWETYYPHMKAAFAQAIHADKAR